MWLHAHVCHVYVPAGMFILSREAVYHLTGGKYDAFSWTKANTIAAPYAFNYPMFSNDAAPYGDVLFTNANVGDAIQRYIAYAFNVPPTSFPRTGGNMDNVIGNYVLGGKILSMSVNMDTLIRPVPPALARDGTPITIQVSAGQVRSFMVRVPLSQHHTHVMVALNIFLPISFLRRFS